MSQMIHQSLSAMGTATNLKQFFESIPDNAVAQILEHYGSRSFSIIANDPYRPLKDIEGFEFKDADVIAAKAGVTGKHPLRVQAAIFECLQAEAKRNGSCCMPEKDLLPMVKTIIPNVDEHEIMSALTSLTGLSQGRMRLHLDEDGAVYINRIWRAEFLATAKIHALSLCPCSNRCFSPTLVLRASEKVCGETGIMLDEEQQNAVLKALNSRVCIITGGPGTGKTTVIRVIIETIRMLTEFPRILCMAPTGKAARRMYAATNHPAETIHSYESYSFDSDIGKAASATYQLNADFIIVDEVSMVDIPLAARLMQMVNPKMTQLIFLGDVNQLPPIGPGSFFLDLIYSRIIPVVHLRTTYRCGNSIFEAAECVNRGLDDHQISDFADGDDFRIVESSSAEAPDTAIDAFFDLVRQFGLQETVLLSPTRKNGEGATNQLNLKIQKRLFWDRDPSNLLKVNEFDIGLGDRVMLTRNHIVDNHANGDIGTVTALNEDGTVTVQFDGDTEVTALTPPAVRALVLAYAITIHKTQGSEYKGVVLLFTEEHAFMGNRQLLYTALTRARNKLCFVGDIGAFSSAVKNTGTGMRKSKFIERLTM